EDPRHVDEQLCTVECLQLDGGQEDVWERLVPLDLDQPLTLLADEGLRVRAVLAMDRDSPAARHESDDRIARHRGAASREPHHHVVETLDVAAARARAPATWPP